MSSDLVAKIYWACSDPLTLASQLASAREMPPTDVLQRRISALFEEMNRKCRDAGISEEDARDARYAITAFADEQIFRSAWPGRQEWMSQPLQLLYFNENTAGEGFFQRLAALQQRPDRAHVLEVYYLCLALGFQGQYAVRGGEGLAVIIAEVGAQLARAAQSSDVISPNGLPRERVRGVVAREMPILTLAIVLFVGALVLFVVLKLVLASKVSDAVKQLGDQQPTTAPAGNGAKR